MTNHKRYGTQFAYKIIQFDVSLSEALWTPIGPVNGKEPGKRGSNGRALERKTLESGRNRRLDRQLHLSCEQNNLLCIQFQI